MGITYRDSGVDIDKGNTFVKEIGPIVKSTFNRNVITDIGGFGALYSGTFTGMKDPVLVSGTDGVGTKIKIAQEMNVHDTIGIDAVAMCVNDILTSGAKPLFFLDYIACGKIGGHLVDIIKGIAEGCRISGCSLIGGETAEHPKIMSPNDYDIAGFCVGVVEKDKIINGAGITSGDLIIGLPSSGLHSNGFSLVRKLFFEIKKYKITSKIADLPGPLGQVILEPTRIYCDPILQLISRGIQIRGLVHITGGGFYENIPRILPENTAALINKSAIPVLPIFKVIQQEGEIDEREMYKTFNMGIGMMIVVQKENKEMIEKELFKAGESPIVIGEVIKYKNERIILK